MTSLIRDGAWDTYCHTAPCVLPRWGTALDVATEALARGFSGLVLQSHHEGTTGRAAISAQATPGLSVLGGVTLNEYCGGLSAKTVRAHLLAGARLVWLPTTDAAAHASSFGGTGRSMTGSFDPPDRSAGISILADGRLRPEMLEILDAVAGTPAVLCTGHLAMKEVEALIGPARAREVPLVINHPFFIMHPPVAWWRNLPPDGVFVQFATVDDPSDPRLPPLEQVISAIHAIGPDRCMLGSEARAPVNPVQQLLLFCRTLEVAGVPQRDIHTMACSTPQRLFGSR